MSKALCSGELAELYLARNPGLENRVRLGDLFRLIRKPDGGKLPEGTALQQRINDRIRSDRKRGRTPTIRTAYEDQRGAVRAAFYWMTKRDAKRVLAARKRAAMLAKRKAA